MIQPIKTQAEINIMRSLGRVHAIILRRLEQNIFPGMTTQDIDILCAQYLMEDGVLSSCLGYQGFSGNLCTSVNEIACHGVPGNRVLNIGDIINIDLAINKHGMHTDSSIMVQIGEVDHEAKMLIQGAYACMMAGIEEIKPGNSLLDIAMAIEHTAKRLKLKLDEMFCGHGIGSSMHQAPDVHNTVPRYARSRKRLHDYKLTPGMTLTVEPILMAGEIDLVILKDGWSAASVDGRWSAQYEHTILVNHSGREILTSSLVS
jgi:methionyl aminopeptidase